MQAADNHHAAQQIITKGLSTTVYKKDGTAWHQWKRFCSWLKIAPDLKDIQDPIPFLQCFANHVSAGLLSVQGQPIKKQLAEQ